MIMAVLKMATLEVLVLAVETVELVALEMLEVIPRPKEIMAEAQQLKMVMLEEEVVAREQLVLHLHQVL